LQNHKAANPEEQLLMKKNRSSFGSTAAFATVAKDESTKGSINGGENKDEDKLPLQVPFLSLFKYADALDICLMVSGVILAGVSGAAYPYFNVLFGTMLDKLNTGKMSLEEVVNNLCISFVVLAAIMFFASFGYAACWTFAGDRQAYKIRTKYLDAVLRQDIPWFDVNKPSELPTAITDATLKLQDGLGRKIGDVLQFTAQFLGGFIIAFLWCWKLTLVLLSVFPICMISMFCLVKTAASATQEGDEQYRKAGAVAWEVLSSIRTVASLTGERKEVDRYKAFLVQAEKIGIKKGISLGLGNGLVFGCVFMTYALGFWYGAQLVAHDVERQCTSHCVTGGKVMTTFFSVIMGAMALGQSSPGISALGKARAAAVKVFETIARVPAIDSSSEAGESLEHVKGTLEAHNLTFAYPTRPNNIVYRGFSLKIEAGETMALVGGSGEGKSTLMGLVLRFYDAQEGQITLDGKPLNTLNLKWYRSQIGYVGQEPVLFAGSISDNIKYGKPDATPEEIERAAKSANAHSFIMKFPQGYETNTGEAGAKLSGGQKQRIAIARAVVKNPKILLLDEATSALDNESERVVQKALDELQETSSFTTLVIAHRLTTIKNVDRIAVVCGGKIAELGTHSELVALSGVYAQLVNGGGAVDEQAPSSSPPIDDIVNRPSFVETKEELERIEDRLYSLSLPAAGAVELVRASFSVVDQLEHEAAIARTSPNDVESGSQGRKKVGMGQILTYSAQEWPFLLMGAMGACCVGASFPIWGTLLARVQNMYYQADADSIRNSAKTWCMAFAVLGAGIFFANIAQWWGLSTVGERLTRRLRGLAFASMVRHNIGWFDSDENMTGNLIDRLSTDASKVHKVAGDQIGKMCTNMFSLVVGLAIAFSASWQMALAVLGVFPLFVAAMAINMRLMVGESGNGDNMGEGGAAGSTLTSAVTGIRTVSSFNMQSAVSVMYRQGLLSLQKARNKATLMSSSVFGFSQAMMFLMYAFLFWLGAKLIAKGKIDFLQLMTALLTIILASIGLGQTTADSGDQSEAAAATDRIFTLLHEADNLALDALSTEGNRLDSLKGSIKFSSIKFAYPTRPDQLVYSGEFNLEIEYGKTVALVGPSGGGKSTVMGLLLRFYEPLSGSILLDGHPISSFNIAWLRQQIGYVGQEPVLFSGTIRSNITYGKADATNDEVIAAAQAANAHEFITSFQLQYDTDVGEKSILLSGGQKQRIAIARAVIRNPKILLLDEATSALDNESERVVQKALDDLQLQQKRTTLVIAHRLSTIRNADAIAVISQGKVAELGTHEELLKIKDGVYVGLQNA